MNFHYFHEIVQQIGKTEWRRVFDRSSCRQLLGTVWMSTHQLSKEM